MSENEPTGGMCVASIVSEDSPNTIIPNANVEIVEGTGVILNVGAGVCFMQAMTNIQAKVKITADGYEDSEEDVNLVDGVQDIGRRFELKTAD